MLVYFARRGLILIATLLFAAGIIFVALEVLPGDPALVILGMEASDDTLAALRAELGLDRPAHMRFIYWIGDIIRFDAGVSHTYGMNVGTLIVGGLMVTAPLAAMAFTLALLIGLPLGVFAATHHNRFGDYGAIGFIQVGMSMPNFWFGILVVMLFATTLGWLPSGGFEGWQAGVGSAVASLILPAIALGLPEAAILARVTRSAVLEVLGAEFVRTARAKGVPYRRLIIRHVLRAALVPIVTILGLQFAVLFAGSIVIEQLFSLPGLGRLVYRAVSTRDVITARDAVMVIVGMVILVNFVVDILVVIVDPRIRRHK